MKSCTPRLSPPLLAGFLSSVLAAVTMVACSSGGGSSPAPAGWSYVSLHPEAFDYSEATCLNGGTIGGSGTVMLTDYRSKCDHPLYWSAPRPGAAIDLMGSGASLQVPADIFGMDGTYQGGNMSGYAVFWNGTPAYPPAQVAVEATPGFTTIAGISQGWAVGQYMQLNSNVHQARLWNLPGATRVDLTPAGAGNAGVWAIEATSTTDPGTQAGRVDTGAALWRGTAASYLDLHPGDMQESNAWCLYQGHQGGYACPSPSVYHAALWAGTAASFQDLHPTTVAGVTDSFIRGMTGTVQVGNILFGDLDTSHAFLWRGSASNVVDLQKVLPADYTYSMAEAVAVVGQELWVVGYAYNDTRDRQEAMLWKCSSAQ